MSIAKPNLFIVGAAKAGTSSLHDILNQHDDICMSSVKEPHFFSEVSQLKNNDPWHTLKTSNEKEYLSLWANGDYKYLGESSPSYMWDQKACHRISAFNPASKIIMLLRDPVMRAYSHYLMDFQSNREKRSSFLRALADDKGREPKGWGISRLYEELGFYSAPINNYQQTFGKNNVLVLFYEELFNNLTSQMLKFWDFLDIAPSTVTLQHKNASTNYTSFGKMVKKVGIGNLINSKIKDKLKSLILTERKASLGDLEIRRLIEIYRNDILLQKELGFSFYYDYFKTQYHIDLASVST
ncbi:MAG: sulfotransferase domain-containing protein [Cyclobacteriaceae bacterium]